MWPMMFHRTSQLDLILLLKALEERRPELLVVFVAAVARWECAPDRVTIRHSTVSPTAKPTPLEK